MLYCKNKDMMQETDIPPDLSDKGNGKPCTISHLVRIQKGTGYTPQGAYERWVAEISEFYGISKAEAENLAIVRAERERIENEEQQC